MKQKIVLMAGAVAVAGGVLIAAAATGQASAADRDRPAPAPRATVALGDQLSASDSGLVSPLGEFGAGRRNPRA